jgi:hypothetical protein
MRVQEYLLDALMIKKKIKIEEKETMYTIGKRTNRELNACGRRSLCARW